MSLLSMPAGWRTCGITMFACLVSRLILLMMYLLLAQALEEAQVDFALHIYRNGQHGLSTADAQVYPANQLPPVSWVVSGWLEALHKFWKEIGFEIREGA